MLDDANICADLDEPRHLNFVRQHAQMILQRTVTRAVHYPDLRFCRPPTEQGMLPADSGQLA